MEGEGCQPTASESSEILGTGPVKVRLPSMASMTGSVFSEPHVEAAYRQGTHGIGPETRSSITSVPETDSLTMLREAEDKHETEYSRMQPGSGTIQSVLSSRNNNQQGVSEHQGALVPQLAAKRIATPRHPVAIPLNLVIPRIPRKNDELSGSQGAGERRPLTQLDDISPTEEGLPDLIIPRCRSKGKEGDFDDQRMQGPIPFAAESRPSEPPGNYSENVSISAERSDQEVRIQHTSKTELSPVIKYLEEADLVASGQQKSDSLEIQDTAGMKRVTPETSIRSRQSKHYQPSLPEDNEEGQNESRDEHTYQEGTCAQSPTTANSSQETNKKVCYERPAILTQLMLKFNVRDLSRPEPEPEPEVRSRSDSEEREREENNKQVETSVGVCAEQSRQEAEQVTFYYPKQKESGLAPNSAPLIPSTNNIVSHEAASSLSLCEGDLLRQQKASSVPVPPKQDMCVEESGAPDDDALSRQPIQGIIMGGPSLSPTRQGSYATHGSPGFVRRRQIPSMHGVVEDAATSIVPSEAQLVHSHLDGVVNHLVAVQDKALGAVLQRLDTIARDIHLLRADLNAHNKHLRQLTDRVVAIEEIRSDSPITGEVAERRGDNSDEPDERQMTRSIGIQTTTATTPPSNSPSGGQAISVSHPSPVDTQPHPAPEIANPGSVNTSLRNQSGGQPKPRSRKRNHPRNGGLARNIGRGGTIAQQRVLSPPERAVPPSPPEIVASPPQARQYQHPSDVPQAFHRQFPPGLGRGSGLLPVVVSSSATPIPFPSMSTTPNAGGQYPPPFQGLSTGGMPWGGTWDWYHRAYPGNV